MKYQRIFLSLTFLSIIIYKFECTAHVCENFGIYERSGLSEEDSNCRDDVCCNSNILQVMRTTFELAKKESYQDAFKKIVKSFKILSKEIKASHIMMSPQRKEYQQTKRQIVSLDVSTHNRKDGEDVYNALHYLACNISQNPESIARLGIRVSSTLKNAKCICKHPIVKKLVEERTGSITSKYTNYKDGFVQLRELTIKVNLVGKGNLEDELLEKQLKAIVCKQCSGEGKPICMSECHELVNLDMKFEAKKLQLLEGIVKLVKERIEQVSTLAEEFNLEFETAKQSIMDLIAAEILEGRDFNQDCEEGNENSNIDVGGSCSTPPSKCNADNKASCTLKNCGDQCMVNCCNENSKNKCTIPTCVGCKGTAAATCLANTNSQCSGVEQQSRNNVEKITEQLYTIQDQIEESNLGSHDVRGSCSTPPSKCNADNKASCTLKNCGDQCMVNCCNGNSKNKCTIPTCVGCKGTAAATCLANTNSQCAGVTQTQSRINVEKITELLYTIQDQIEESKRNLGSHGRYICQQLMETHEDINLIEECNEREFGGDFDNIMNEEFSEEQMEYYSDANQPMNDALNEFNELGVFG